MEKQTTGRQERQKDPSESLVKRVVQVRRLESGFQQAIPAESWAAAAVQRALRQAAEYLTMQCCQADRELLSAESHPDDDDLEAALQAVERALNSLMTFGVPTPAPEREEKLKEEYRPISGNAQAEHIAAGQEAYPEIAATYLRWLLDRDSWIGGFRNRFPQSLTEKELIDFLRSPLSQVLSFKDFDEIGLCPLTTTGRVLSEQRTPDGVPVPGSEAAKSLEKTRQFEETWVLQEFIVEMDCPDGTTVCHTVQRIGKPGQMRYRVAGLDWWWQNVDTMADAKAVEWIWGKFAPGVALAERSLYPNFPHIHLEGVCGSITYEAYAICSTLRDNNFYSDMNEALRYLFMEAIFPSTQFQCYRDALFVQEQQTTITGSYHLTVPPWALPEEVADYWRRVRPIMARERRLPTAEHLSLFLFVLRNTSVGSEPRWAELARLWGREQGQSMTRDRLHRTFARVRDALFPPREPKTDDSGRFVWTGEKDDGVTSCEFHEVPSLIKESDDSRRKSKRKTKPETSTQPSP